jgi:hypothetical protein
MMTRTLLAFIACLALVLATMPGLAGSTQAAASPALSAAEIQGVVESRGLSKVASGAKRSGTAIGKSTAKAGTLTAKKTATSPVGKATAKGATTAGKTTAKGSKKAASSIKGAFTRKRSTPNR